MLVYFFLNICFILRAELQRREIFSLLVHSLNDHSDWDWMRPTLHLGLHIGAVGANILRPSPATFSGALIMSRVGSRAAVYPYKMLNPLPHSASPFSVFF